MYGVDYKLIAFMNYSTVTGALVVTSARNCSGFYNGVGSVNIRVGTPGPLTAANTPANLATEFSRAIGNLLPVIRVGTAATAATITQVNDTTYQILQTDLAAPGAAEGVIWFGLFTLMA
jgi:hypothetical protein